MPITETLALADNPTKMLDLRAAEYVEVKISRDGKTLWVNTSQGCKLRTQKIVGTIEVADDRRQS
jgi:hypothetical protein